MIWALDKFLNYRFRMRVLRAVSRASSLWHSWCLGSSDRGSGKKQRGVFGILQVGRLEKSKTFGRTYSMIVRPTERRHPSFHLENRRGRGGSGFSNRLFFFGCLHLLGAFYSCCVQKEAM